MVGKYPIAHIGAFDHDSYGDLLFPIVAQWACPQFSWVHISPTGSQVHYSNCCSSISVEEADHMKFSAVVLGGGDLVSCSRWSGPKTWAEKEKIKGSTLSRLWSSSSYIAVKNKVPLLWNSPGVDLAVNNATHSDLRTMLRAVSFFSVRDEISASILADYTESEIQINPDSAILVSRMWPTAEDCNRDLAVCWSAQECKTRQSEIISACALLSKRYNVSRLDLMRWQEADDLPTIKSQNLSDVCDIARFIGASAGYIGNSLHGFITAVSYKRRAVLIVPKEKTSAHKYRGVVMALGLNPQNFIASDWCAAVGLFESQIDQVDDSVFCRAMRPLGRLDALVGRSVEYGFMDRMSVRKAYVSVQHEQKGSFLSHACVRMRKAIGRLRK